jgi:hypothetical protein
MNAAFHMICENHSMFTVLLVSKMSGSDLKTKFSKINLKKLISDPNR